MRIVSSGINLYLALGLLLNVACGCRSPEERSRARELSTLRLHLEVALDTTGRSAPVPVFRQNPVLINVETEPFLDEAHLVSARVVEDSYGGFAIRLEFDRLGTSLLNATTLANPGRRIVVGSQFPAQRWLAAPLIQRRLADGVFVFTPDASREEAERIVRGLNNAVNLARKRSLVY
jgi:hypothetical protein